MTYALMVRDIRDGWDRSRLDGILSGQIPVPAPTNAPTEPSEVYPDDDERLREVWGATPKARQGQAALDQLLATLPRQNPR